MTKNAVFHEFNVGDKVLVLLPVLGSTMVKEKLSVTVVDTPDRKHKRRVCHVNMLKPLLHSEIPADISLAPTVN